MRLNLNLIGALLLGTGLLGACRQAEPTGPLVVATTGHVHDALVELTKGTGIELELLCGPGVDPHAYSASTQDVQALQRADAIVYNGFHLEAQLADVLHRGPLSAKTFAMASRFPESSRLDWVEDGEIDPEAPFDPHIWNDLRGWSECVSGLASHLAGVYPELAGAFATNATLYLEEIEAADRWAEAELAKIPEARRVLVSGHDAFQYFARRYGLETYSVLGIGNDPEADIRTMQDVARTVAERRVPVIFLESLTNPKVTRALEEACEGRGWSVEIASAPLYSDDLGQLPPADTYLGAFRWNVETIVAALGDGA